MILLFHRREAIRFRPITHRFHRWMANGHRLRHFGQAPGGPQVVVDNLLRELAIQNTMSWAQGYRDCPENPGIDAIWVVRGTQNLRWAIQNKHRMKAGQLWAGPNISVVPQEAEKLLLSPEIDRVVVPSEWVSAFYAEQAPVLRAKLRIWPVGIDTDYWKPVAGDKKHLLIFNKGQEALSLEITRFLATQGVIFTTLRYGCYDPEEYRTALSEAWGMVYLSASESQGLAVLEALSMDVPVLAWDPGKCTYMSPELGQSFLCPATSIPYFDLRCGERFAALPEWSSKFVVFREHLSGYHPRDYILNAHLDLASNLESWKVFNG